MSNTLTAIISKVPERLSLFSRALYTLNSQFAFFSDLASLLSNLPANSPAFIVVDSLDAEAVVSQGIASLRRTKGLSEAVILVIVRDGDIDTAIAVLEAGANDYLSDSQADRDLADRAAIHWKVHRKALGIENDTEEFQGIYPDGDRVLVQDVVCYIRKNIASINSISDLALQVGLSEKKLNSLFNAHFEQSASSYMREYRILKAKSLLTQTKLPIAQLALQVGCSNPASFSTKFKHVVGMSPVRYRVQSSQQ